MKQPLLLLFSCFTFFLSQAQQPFVTTWEVTADDLEITIPTNTDDYTYDYSIDFGDGTILNNQTGNVTHIYSAPGIYSVSISGLFPHFYSRGLYDVNDLNEQLISIDQWGDNPWLSMKGAFAYSTNLVVNATDSPDLSLVSDMSSMFFACYLFNQNINSWNVSNVTDMSLLFSNCISFNQPLDNWNVSSVTNMNSMFIATNEFNQDIEDWDVSNVNDISHMFAYAEAFNQALNSWNLSNVSQMERVFARAKIFNQPLDNWDVSNVVNMQGMFFDAENFNQPIGNWNISNVINMADMFNEAESFNQPLASWNMSNVKFMYRMFRLADSFNQPLDNWDVSKVTNMRKMFMGADAFDQPLNSWDVSSVKDFDRMFSGADLFNQPLNNWDVSNIFPNAGLQNMFSYAHSFNQDLSSWEFTNGSLSGIINGTNMTKENYDLLIDKLVSSGIQDGVLGAKEVLYCNAFKRQQLIDLGWTITDWGQASDCNLNYVSGNVLYDADNDGCDPSDFDLSNYLINVNNGTDDAAFDMDNNGNYVIGLDSGTYTLSFLNLNSNYISNPTTQTVNFTGQDEILDDIDFCITANQQFEDLAIDIFPLEAAIPGFETDYEVIVSNNGTQTVPNIQVTFGYDESFQTYVTSTVPTSATSTDILDFELTNLEPFSQEVFEVTLINVVPPTLNNGDILNLSVSVTPDTNDTTPDDNTTVFNQTVVNSFDPNDKMVVQGDQIVDEDIDQYLDYRIRFQNLGTANALNVKITDTIDNNLDWTTFQPITSSHDYRIEIVDGEQINFYFDNINLPFETADPEGSNGYITYKIKPKPTVQIGDTFENTAYIYFDFNLPIITNTVVTAVVDNLDAVSFDLNKIKIYPNPVSDQLNIELPDSLNLNSIELFDIQGKLIRSFEYQTELDFSRLQQGTYILKLNTDRGSYHYKIIKE